MLTQTDEPNSNVPDGVRYARWAGHSLGCILILIGVVSVLGELTGAFNTFKAYYYIFYGLVLNIPFTGISEKQWKKAYGLLVVCSIAFVFVMVVSVMYNYMQAAEQGERLGVPGLEGTLIFIALMQVPVILFQRKPDLLD